MTAIGRNLTGVTIGLLGLASFATLAFGLVFLKLSPLVVGALLVGGTIVTVSAFRPYLGVHVMLGLVFFEGVFSMAQDVTFTKVMGGLITAGWLANSMARRRIRDTFNLQALLVMAYLAWCTLAVTRALDTDIAMSRTMSYGLLGLSMIMIGSVVDTEERLHKLLVAFACWTILSAAIALVMYYTGATVVAVGLIGNRNALALYINMGAIAALLAYPGIRGVLPRLVVLVGVPVLLLALAHTLSSTGLIVMAVVLLSIWYRLARERGFLLLLGSTLACVVIVFFLPTEFWKRAGTILPSIERREDTFGTRVRLWATGIRLIQDRPLLGVGPGNFNLASARYAEGGMAGARLSTHNAYVGVACESGLVGLALFLAIIFNAMTGVRRAMRAARQVGRSDLALGGVTVETMVLAAMLNGLTQNVEMLKLTWIALGMCVAFAAIVRMTLVRERATVVQTAHVEGVPEAAAT